jgi:hypothetical protein
MLTPEEIDAITKHEVAHRVVYCSCPCFDALIRFAKSGVLTKLVKFVNDGNYSMFATPEEIVEQFRLSQS